MLYWYGAILDCTNFSEEIIQLKDNSATGAAVGVDLMISVEEFEDLVIHGLDRDRKRVIEIFNAQPSAERLIKLITTPFEGSQSALQLIEQMYTEFLQNTHFGQKDYQAQNTITAGIVELFTFASRGKYPKDLGLK